METLLQGIGFAVALGGPFGIIIVAVAIAIRILR